MPSRKRRALVGQQIRDPATGRWLPGKKMTAAAKTGTGMTSAGKMAVGKKAGASPSPTSSEEAEAIAMAKDEAEDEMRYMTFRNLQEEVCTSLKKIKVLEEMLAKEKNRKVAADTHDLAIEKSRKQAFEEKVLEVSKAACPYFWV